GNGYNNTQPTLGAPGVNTFTGTATQTMATTTGIVNFPDLIVTQEANNYTLPATDTASGTFAATSTSFNVGPNVPNQVLLVSGDSQSAVVGTDLANQSTSTKVAPFVVVVEDQYNNTVAGATVQFAITSGGTAGG